MKPSETSAAASSMDLLQQFANPSSHSCMTGTSFGALITTFDEQFMASVRTSQITQNKRLLRELSTTGV